jgi:hypothetical protein
MPENIQLPDKASLTWSGKELEIGMRKQLVLKLKLIGTHLEGKVKQNVSASTRSNGPSKPGEFPHADTGLLRNSIFYNVDDKQLSVTVGTNLKYGLYLEYGTAGPRRIEATGKKALSWIGKDGVRRFARFLIIPAMAPRSYLRRTMMEQMPKIEQLLQQQWKDMRVGSWPPVTNLPANPTQSK